MKNKKIWFVILAVVVIIIMLVWMKVVNKQKNSKENEPIEANNLTELKVERDEKVDVNNIMQDMQKNANDIKIRNNTNR